MGAVLLTAAQDECTTQDTHSHRSATAATSTSAEFNASSRESAELEQFGKLRQRNLVVARRVALLEVHLLTNEERDTDAEFSTQMEKTTRIERVQAGTRAERLYQFLNAEGRKLQLDVCTTSTVAVNKHATVRATTAKRMPRRKRNDAKQQSRGRKGLTRRGRADVPLQQRVASAVLDRLRGNNTNITGQSGSGRHQQAKAIRRRTNSTPHP